MQPHSVHIFYARSNQSCKQLDTGPHKCVVTSGLELGIPTLFCTLRVQLLKFFSEKLTSLVEMLLQQHTDWVVKSSAFVALATQTDDTSQDWFLLILPTITAMTLPETIGGMCMHVVRVCVVCLVCVWSVYGVCLVCVLCVYHMYMCVWVWVCVCVCVKVSVCVKMLCTCAYMHTSVLVYLQARTWKFT